MVHVEGPTDDHARPIVGDEEFHDWHPPTEGIDRAVVLAGGGATGIAWEAGVIIGLRDGGIDVRDADTMIGTSAGSMVAAHLRVGTDEGDAFARIREGAPLASYGRLATSDAAGLAGADARVHVRRLGCVLLRHRTRLGGAVRGDLRARAQPRIGSSA